MSFSRVVTGLGMAAEGNPVGSVLQATTCLLAITDKRTGPGTARGQLRRARRTGLPAPAPVALTGVPLRLARTSLITPSEEARRSSRLSRRTRGNTRLPGRAPRPGGRSSRQSWIIRAPTTTGRWLFSQGPVVVGRIVRLEDQWRITSPVTAGSRTHLTSSAAGTDERNRPPLPYNRRG